MIVKCKDGEKLTFEESVLDSVYFVASSGLSNSISNCISTTLSYEIDLKENRVLESGDFYQLNVPCVEGVEISLHKYNRLTTDRLIIFLDQNGSSLSRVECGSSNRGWSTISAIAPKNTASVLIRFYEKESDYGKTKVAFNIKKEIVQSVIGKAAKLDKVKTIGINGDSTGQGLSEVVNNEQIHNEGVFYKGSVGGENIFASAARQGSIPLVVEPFTIPKSSTARWSNTSSKIDTKGDDPEITYTPSFLAEAVKDGDTIKQVYPNVYFSETYPFYASIAGVDGYIYTLSGYTVNEDGTVTTNGSEKHSYFHRLTPGEEIVLTDTCHTVSKDAELWKTAYNINMMGTNGGFLYFDDNRLVGTQYVTYQQYAKNICDVLSVMDEYCGHKMLIVGMFCECFSHIYHKDFYSVYDKLCEERFGTRFYNARNYLMNDAWKDLGITLTEDDKANINNGLAPWSLFGDGKGVKMSNPHLTTGANKVLLQQILNKTWELGWINEKP